ncbi:PaaI family thioesterase [Pseudoramibacter sp.]|uniref:PaaI family thioesterase n=1 Tax=Pseudoramibacter sp. TaxID=2034862 RepID=UPI0025FEE52F|nr:PaaI family thioesterase [Pseudoramibacter sp.]MCH4072129.1 PaaI family thioesterase [Pseudoramibacter sp.]MCH4105899.1 PaaI family thioesterase [Pseudoramibacter sp.]
MKIKNKAKQLSEEERALLLAETKERFAKDRFATKKTECEVADVAPGYAKCTMPITEDHRNGLGLVMGGAIFTLADFTFAIASNTGQPDTVSLDAHITYLNASKGKTLYAESECLKSGRRTCAYIIHVTDDLGVRVADLLINGVRV